MEVLIRQVVAASVIQAIVICGIINSTHFSLYTVLYNQQADIYHQSLSLSLHAAQAIAERLIRFLPYPQYNDHTW